MGTEEPDITVIVNSVPASTVVVAPVASSTVGSTESHSTAVSSHRTSKSTLGSTSSLKTIGSHTTTLEARANYRHRGGDDSGTGATVGVSVGITILPIMLVALAAYFFYRRHIRRKRPHETAHPSCAANTGGGEEGQTEQSPDVTISKDTSTGPEIQEKDGELLISKLGLQANTHEMSPESGVRAIRYELPVV